MFPFKFKLELIQENAQSGNLIWGQDSTARNPPATVFAFQTSRSVQSFTNILIGEVIESINRPIGSKLTPPVAATGWLWSTETSETHKHLTKPWQTASVTVNGGIRLLLLHEDVWSAGRLDAENRTVFQTRREMEYIAKHYTPSELTSMKVHAKIQ